jgi:hypothetical protein
MIRLRLSALIVLVIILSRSVSLYAQNNDPLEYSYEYPRIGAEFGLTSVWQSGVYSSGCGRFEEGAKINALVAAAYDKPFAGNFRFEALLGYQGRSLSSSYPSRENIPVVTDGTSGDRQVIRTDVDFENVGRASFSYFFLLPSAKFYFTKGLYAGAGINAGLLMTKTTQYTKNIVSKTFQRFGRSWTVSYQDEESSDPYSKVFPEEELTDASSFAVDAALYVGAEFPVAKRFKLSPRLVYTIPFTPVLNTPDELKLNTFQFLLGVRYELFK